MAKSNKARTKSPSQTWATFVKEAIVAIAAAVIVGVLALYGLYAIAIVIAVLVVSVGVAVGSYSYWHLLRLRKWSELTDVTDLTNFEVENELSPYMPQEILQREAITKLWVMGNGCGKWSRKVTAAVLHAKVKIIRSRGDGEIRFLASCPLELYKTGDEAKKIKAIDNADSLMRLRQLGRQTGGLGGNFQIKTYKHTATLRLILLNDADCIVGHYQEDGIADSLKSPLLVFRRTSENEWGFGHAFHRLFVSEWHRATEPDPGEWTEIEKLASLKDRTERTDRAKQNGKK